MVSFSAPFFTLLLLPEVHALLRTQRGQTQPHLWVCLKGPDAASPVCVACHVGERGGEIDEPGEAADEVHAHKGVLDRTEGSERGP